MLRLTIDGNEIELYENEPVNLSYQFTDIQQINASSSSFSQTFRVPLTKKNQDYFGPVNEFGLIYRAKVILVLLGERYAEGLRKAGTARVDLLYVGELIREVYGFILVEFNFVSVDRKS